VFLDVLAKQMDEPMILNTGSRRANVFKHWKQLYKLTKNMWLKKKLLMRLFAQDCFITQKPKSRTRKRFSNVPAINLISINLIVF